VNLVDVQKLNGFSIPKNFRGRSVVIVQLWWFVQSTLFANSPQFMYGWRVWLLRLFGAKIGRSVIIRPSVKITYPWKLTIGDYSWVGDNVTLYTLGEIIIGENVVVSQNSYLCTGSHDFTSKYFDIYEKPIVINSQAWVASDVFVHPGVTIGTLAVIGARSTVMHDIPPNMIAYGNPAEPVRNRIVG
jgi:putative colanic acid biosynthesis acetyltransferase WcaF